MQSYMWKLVYLITVESYSHFFHPHWFDNLIYTVHLNNGLFKRKYRAKVKKRVWKEIEAV